MSALNKLKIVISEAINNLTGHEVELDKLTISPTRKEFEGDYTLLVFPLTRFFGKKPEEVGEMIGEELKNNSLIVDDYNIIKGFLNLSFSTEYWKSTINDIYKNDKFGFGEKKNQKVMVEFSSPNTNKPLHLGHIRNILLGWSVSEILKAAGYDVINTQIVNDRGIAICKSMLAWQKWGEGTSPEKSGKKGDFLVGDFYVMFDQKFNKEYLQWQKSEVAQKIYDSTNKGKSEKEFYAKYKNEYFNDYSELGLEARNMLIKWEEKDADVISLWKKMNSWVLGGFNETYEKLGVVFDKSYFESSTYILGKDIVESGLKEDVFYREEDGSIWIDLEDAKMDKKIVMRSDGTSVYITQDIGTAELRYKDFGTEKMIYVVGDEQEYHFKVLFEIMKRLKKSYADGMYHLSYGMVELPSGKMKSREGKVVDADDLMVEVIDEARKSAKERGEVEGITEKEREDIYEKVGMAALKFFILKVNPKRRMIFNPEESVDLQGQTGPYIQNAFVRIKSILKKGEEAYSEKLSDSYLDFNIHEKSLIKALAEFPNVIQQAAQEYEPSHIANYTYNLAKKYHKFYSEVSVLKAENESAISFRIKLSKSVAKVLESSMNLLGIKMPERM